jgi:hypothetical protein
MDGMIGRWRSNSGLYEFTELKFLDNLNVMRSGDGEKISLLCAQLLSLSTFELDILCVATERMMIFYDEKTDRVLQQFLLKNVKSVIESNDLVIVFDGTRLWMISSKQ